MSWQKNLAKLVSEFGDDVVDRIKRVLPGDATAEEARKAAQRIAKPAEKAKPRTVAAKATSERVPYVGSGHLTGVVKGSDKTKRRYSADPRASWTDKGGEDIIYKALGVKQEPTVPATGFYKPPEAPLETNPATVGAPLVRAIEGDVAPEDRAMLDAAEALRAYTDAQGAGAWHTTLTDVPASEAGAVFVPRSEPARAEDLVSVQDLANRYGLTDVVDTGRGVTVTNFYPGTPPGEETTASLRSGFGRELSRLLGGEPMQVKTPSGYLPTLEEAGAPGSGIATGRLFEALQGLSPEAMAKLDESEALRQRYLSGLALDEEMARAGYGTAREDIQRARRIMGEQGLRGLLEQYKGGAALPSIAALMSAYGLSGPADEEPGY